MEESSSRAYEMEKIVAVGDAPTRSALFIFAAQPRGSKVALLALVDFLIDARLRLRPHRRAGKLGTDPDRRSWFGRPDRSYGRWRPWLSRPRRYPRSSRNPPRRVLPRPGRGIPKCTMPNPKGCGFR